jgi:hypothetical protein
MTQRRPEPLTTAEDWQASDSERHPPLVAIASGSGSGNGNTQCPISVGQRRRALLLPVPADSRLALFNGSGGGERVVARAWRCSVEGKYTFTYAADSDVGLQRLAQCSEACPTSSQKPYLFWRKHALLLTANHHRRQEEQSTAVVLRRLAYKFVEDEEASLGPSTGHWREHMR